MNPSISQTFYDVTMIPRRNLLKVIFKECV